MTQEEAEIRIKAAAFTVANERGWRAAVEALRKTAEEIERMQWQGPNNR